MNRPELVLESAQGLSALQEFRRRARDFAQACQFSEKEVDDIELALDEAVTNVILHAYAPNEIPRVEVKASSQAGGVVFMVRDFGQAFDPKPITDAQVRQIILNRQRHGLGRYIMQQCMSSVEYHSIPGQYNETVMTKRHRS